MIALSAPGCSGTIEGVDAASERSDIIEDSSNSTDEITLADLVDDRSEEALDDRFDGSLTEVLDSNDLSVTHELQEEGGWIEELSHNDLGEFEIENPDSVCTPRTCAELGWECGETLSCGQMLNCGTCTGLYNTACTNGRCQCLPDWSCAEQCGVVPDKCGGAILCGICSSQTCGGAGVANQCGVPPACNNQIKDGVCGSQCTPENDLDCVPPFAFIPTLALDANEVSYALGNDNITVVPTQLIIKGKKWWVRNNINNFGWSSSGTIFDGESCNGCAFPDQIDSMAVWGPPGGPITQMATRGKSFWIRPDIKNNKIWTAGTMFTEACIAPDCGNYATLSKIDAMTIYPVDPGNPATAYAQIFISGDRWWYRPTISSNQAWTASNKIFAGENCVDCTFPASVETFTVFTWKGKSVSFATQGNHYWYRPDNSQPSWQDGELVPTISVNPSTASASISDYIYGVNLIWHAPHTRYFEDGSNAKFLMTKALEDLSPTIIRFPGGCGGDSFAFDWNDVQTANPGITGMNIDDYADLFVTTRTEPFLTVNLEGEGTGHAADKNCHDLHDHPGTISEALQIIQYLNQYFEQYFIQHPDEKQMFIKHVEVGNEPWAPSTKVCDNWTETWLLSEFLGVYDNLVSTLNDTSIDVTMASTTMNGVDWTHQIPYEQHHIDQVQAHPYVTNPNDPDYSFPWRHADRAEKEVKSLTAFLSTRKNLGDEPIGLALTEYNLPCWVVPCNGIDSLVHPQCGLWDHAQYVAKMLGVFARNEVAYAMIWHVFEDLEHPDNNHWRCGLMEYDGQIRKTPSFSVFQLLANKIRGKYLNHPFDDEYLFVIPSLNEAKQEISVSIINHEGIEKKIRLHFPGIITENVLVESLVGSSLDSNSAIYQSQFFGKTPPGESYILNIPPFGVSVGTLGICINGDGLCPLGCTRESDPECPLTD